MPWEVTAVSARRMGQAPLRKSLPPRLTSSCPLHTALPHALRSNLRISKMANHRMFWIPRLFANSHNDSHLLSPQLWKVLCCRWLERVVAGGPEIRWPVVAFSDQFTFLEAQFLHL